MKDKFDSYLDTFNRITIIYPKKNITDIRNKKFFILIYDEMLSIEIASTEELEFDYKFSCILPETISLNAEYTIIDESSNRSILKSGSVVRTDLFEMLYYYSPSDLGVIYTKEMTSFKVWSPVAKEIELELVDREGKIEFHDLKLLFYHLV